jgi:hypothetical protein
MFNTDMGRYPKRGKFICNTFLIRGIFPIMIPLGPRRDELINWVINLVSWLKITYVSDTISVSSSDYEAHFN